MPRVDTYPDISHSEVANDDEFLIWDTSTSHLKNITATQLRSVFLRGTSADPDEIWQLRTKTGAGISVPHFTPTEEDCAIALDLSPKGSPSDFTSNTGVAWADICNNDLQVPGDYQALRLGIMAAGNVHVGSAFSAGGSAKNLTLQPNGGKVGVGTWLPGYLHTINSSDNPAYSISVADDDKILLAHATSTNAWCTGSVSGDNALRGMGGSIFIGSNATTPTPAITIKPGSPGNVGFGTGAAALNFAVTIDRTVTPALAFRASGAEKGYLGIATDTNDFFTGAAANDVCLRGVGGKIHIGSNATTPTPAITIKPGSPGNVGFGTTSPGAKLDVDGGAIRVANGGAEKVLLSYSAGFDGIIRIKDSADTSKVWLTSNGNSYLNGGNVGVGTTTFNASAVRVLQLGDGTAPVAGTANTSGLVSLLGELNAYDSAGNVTPISPHPKAEIEAKAEPSDPSPYMYTSSNPLLGIKITADIGKTLRLLQEDFRSRGIIKSDENIIWYEDIPKIDLASLAAIQRDEFAKKWKEENKKWVRCPDEEGIEEIEVEREVESGELKTVWSFVDGSCLSTQVPVMMKTLAVDKRIKAGYRLNPDTGDFEKAVDPPQSVIDSAVAAADLRVHIEKYIADRMLKN